MKGKWLGRVMPLVLAVILPWSLLTLGKKHFPPEEALPEQTLPVETQAPDRKIQVLLDGVTREMDLETYILSVVLGEMPGEFEPEALKAQAVVARTYALRISAGSRHQGAVCTVHSCCQAYRDIDDFLEQGGSRQLLDKVRFAVQATAGQVLTYQGELIEATYFSCSGGRTEAAVAVWGTDVPYLQAVDSPGEEQATHFTDGMTFTWEEFSRALGFVPEGEVTGWFGPVTYTSGGGVATMVIGGKTYTGLQLRKLLGLRSTAMEIAVEGGNITITTKGFGHRVGMSQYGAEAMAAEGKTYRQILSHYYPGTSLFV